MKKQLLLGTLIAATVFQGSLPAYAGREEVGSVIGGLIGGAVGSQVGKGNGNKAATVIGAVAGAVIGGNVAGRGEDRRDDRRDDRYEDRRGGHGWGPGRGRPGRPDHGPGPGYGPGRPGPGYPGCPGPGPRPPMPPPPNYGSYQASVQINGISRRPGGQWYRISLQRPISLESVQLQVVRANLRIYETSVVTDYNQRFPIYEMSNTPVIAYGGTVGGFMNRNERIVAIDIRAESFGDFADAFVSVSSREGQPYLYVQPY